MKSHFLFTIATISFIIASCAREAIVSNTGSTFEEGVPVEMSIPFCVSNIGDLQVTRMTLGPEYEGKVYNFYVAVYDSEGNYLTSGYTEKVSSYSQSESGGTNGQIKLPGVSASNCNIYAIANISEAAYNIDVDKLTSKISTEADIRKFTATLAQKTLTNDGFFLMSGWVKNVNIKTDGSVETTAGRTTYSNTVTGDKALLCLDRVNAKINVNITFADPESSGKPTIKTLNMKQWKVVNLPMTSYLFEDSDNDKTSFSKSEDAKDSYFTSSYQRVFHEGTSSGKKTYNFSFYSMENYADRTGKSTAASYADREKQTKDTSTGRNGAWVCAPEYGTYLILEGEVDMYYGEADNEGKIVSANGYTLNSDFTYKIHLGDFRTDINDFDTKRNTEYTYNVTIKGVDDISVEVITSEENAPGATGRVIMAKENYFHADAHYETFVHTFYADNVDKDLTTWYVYTPFAEGKGTEVPIPCDYKWVEFRVNERNYDGSYKLNRREYKPYDSNYTFDYTANYTGSTSPTMTVVELVEYLKRQKSLKEAGQTNYFTSDGKMAVTVFVNENYYEADPRGGSTPQDFWKQFAGPNVKPREMHIITSTKESSDKESMVTSSTLSIKQRVIQTLYSTTKADLKTAWGVETVDENTVRDDDKDNWRCVYAATEKIETYDMMYPDINSTTNGRLNTVREWDLFDPANDKWYTETDRPSTVKWSTYLNLTAESHENSSEDYIPFRMDQDDGRAHYYDYYAYQCMRRNRDNNGDGIIQGNEIRWYMATTGQIAGIWAGEVSIDKEAEYYPYNSTNWHYHYLTSNGKNESGKGQATIIWAEEYGSVSYFANYYQGSTGATGGNRFHIRCCRNLGLPADASPKVEVEPYVKVTYEDNTPINGTYNPSKNIKFDLSNMSEDNYRENRLTDFIYNQEDMVTNNRLPQSFIALAPADAKTYEETDLLTLNGNITINSNPYCADGYRLPNNREMCFLYYFLPKNFWDKGNTSIGYVTRTYWSLGLNGNKKDMERYAIGYYSWSGTLTTDFGGGQFLQKSTCARCVRDNF